MNLNLRSRAAGRLQKEMEEMEAERGGRAALPAQRRAKGFAPAVGAAALLPRLLPVLVYPDPRLRAPNAPVVVSPAVDKSIAQLARDMFHTMYMCAVDTPAPIGRPVPNPRNPH